MRSGGVCLLVASLAIGIPHAVHAQTNAGRSTVAPDSAACRATAELIERMLSRRDVFTLDLTAIDSSSPMPSSVTADLAKAIMAHFIAPDSVPEGVTPIFAFRIRPGGSIDTLRVERPAAEDVERRLLVAFWRADSSRALAIAGSAIEHPIWIRARLDHAIVSESDPSKWRPGVETPLERVATAALGNPPPRYPDVARNASVGDSLIVLFVVDEQGRAMRETAHLRKAKYREFVKAVADHLPRMRFLPAEWSGCPVKSWVEMPFTFEIVQ